MPLITQAQSCHLSRYIMKEYNCTHTYDVHNSKECIYMSMHVISCLIFAHSHTTIMLLGGNIGLVLSEAYIVVCRELHHIILIFTI